MRQPTLAERIVFGIPCIGFCNVTGNHVKPEDKGPLAPLAEEQRENCRRVCGALLPNQALVGRAVPQLPEKK